MEMESKGLSGVGKKVYSPYFVMEVLKMVQAIQDLIYLLTFLEASTCKNDFVVLPLFFRCQSVILLYCNELIKLSFLHAHLKEHGDGLDGITIHPKDES
jgi:hypothetical protein